MKATVYCNARSQTGLIAKDVKIIKLSEAPRYTKKGVMFRHPFAGSHCLTHEQVGLLNLWNLGIRKADVVYPDGTIDVGVWINMKDIVEDEPQPEAKLDYWEAMARVKELSAMDGEAY